MHEDLKFALIVLLIICFLSFALGGLLANVFIDCPSCVACESVVAEVFPYG